MSPARGRQAEGDDSSPHSLERTDGDSRAKSRRRRCLEGCKGTTLVEMLPLPGTLLSSLPGFIQLLKGQKLELDMLGVEG